MEKSEKAKKSFSIVITGKLLLQRLQIIINSIDKFIYLLNRKENFVPLVVYNIYGRKIAKQLNEIECHEIPGIYRKNYH